jgi:hypothetical protein
MDSDFTTSSGHFRLAGALGAFAVLACFGILALSSCHRADGSLPGVTVQEQISPQPPRAGPATVAVDLADAARKPITNANIMVEADMSHPGMSPVFGHANETAPGAYRAQINFNMGGDWVVLLHIKLPDGRRIERQMDVRGVQSN